LPEMAFPPMRVTDPLGAKLGVYCSDRGRTPANSNDRNLADPRALSEVILDSGRRGRRFKSCHPDQPERAADLGFCSGQRSFRVAARDPFRPVLASLLACRRHGTSSHDSAIVPSAKAETCGSTADLFGRPLPRVAGADAMKARVRASEAGAESDLENCRHRIGRTGQLAANLAA
jgi:hypothetical protein